MSGTRTIEVFRPGTFVPMAGGEIPFSAADLAALADAYDAEGAPAPVVVGHPKHDDPAFGWARGFRWDPEAERLFADVGELAPAFVEAVEAGRYRKISLSLFRPEAANNPKPGTWYPKHIGFLGGAAPAVPGLKPVAFAGDEAAVTILGCPLEWSSEFGTGEHPGSAECAEPAFRDVAGLFRGLRDFLIEKFGLEAADRVVPDFQIRWLDDAGAAPAETATTPAFPAFSDPPGRARDAGRSTGGPAVAGLAVASSPLSFPEPAMTTIPDPAAAMATAAATAAEFAARETALVARERALSHREHESFAEGLIAEGRLLPVLKDRVVGLLDGLEPETEIAFSEGGAEVKAPPRQALRDLLSALPKTVTYGPVVPRGEAPAAAEFAAPDGRAVDGGRLELHAKALAYQRQHPGTEYVAAVRAVEAGA